jgi:hypothetical protein
MCGDSVIRGVDLEDVLEEKKCLENICKMIYSNYTARYDTILVEEEFLSQPDKKIWAADHLMVESSSAFVLIVTFE